MRGTLRTAAVLLTAAALAATAGPAQAGGRGGRFDQPEDGFPSPRTVLRSGTPQSAGLDPAPLERAWDTVTGLEQAPEDGHPLYPGAVLTYGHEGRVVMTRASGYARLYADGAGTLLPADERIATRTDTIYDLASISKLFTSVVVMQQVERGRIDLDAPVARYVPEFAAHDKAGITIRQLLTHTSGFPAFLPFWSAYPDPASRMHAALTAETVNEPGSTYLYSDLNLITLGEVVHRVSGEPLERLVAEGITRPLAMRDTGYNPDPSLRPRIAATEFQTAPDRGMVWGQVHDENAWSFGGVAGHAGVFSTARDLSVLAQTMINGGSYGGHRILSPASVQQMITNENAAFPGDDHGLGFELDQRWYMGGLASQRTAGHTGYTGTSLVIDFSSRSFVILLTNRVHPSRSWGSVNPARVAAAQGMAEALAVKPREGRDAWFSGTANARTATLTVPVPATGPAELAFDQLVDTESSDLLTLEVSTDDGASWAPLPYRAGGEVVEGGYAVAGRRTWDRARAALPAGPSLVRWTYTQDASLSGRGVYLDGIAVTQGRRTVVDAEHHPGVVTADGWTRARR
ncbi:serine hydrolase [Microlunatus capsulatus]|uniref:CubicO group peptidase (Beta-lactamase class C family) n=1 Tax=Microlunatus capsulatus TaxID=99117 RepID=A0ABS4Z4B8_9ACTN|nr:serine hydrolase domain-containing protein [Microlunatus capsulatus]MBP2415878.1 CubicO group peptidase (beta-lactamase class C family) [Microlunatus capsulatus]